MAQVGLRSLLVAVGIIVVMSFAVGLLSYEKDDYVCVGKWEYGFKEKTELLRISSLKVYVYPFARECPEDGRHYI